MARNNKRNPRTEAAALTQNADKPNTGESSEPIVEQVTFQSINRGPKTIPGWRAATRMAESVYFPDRSTLYDYYEDFLLDWHLKGILKKRVRNTTNKTLVYKVDGKIVEEMNTLINSKEFRRLRKRRLWRRLGWGLFGADFIAGKKFKWREVPIKHIKPKWQVISYEQSGKDGIDYTKLWNCWILGAEDDDLGELLPAGFYVQLKKGAVSDWAEYIQRFAQPAEVFKYSAGDTQTKQVLKGVVENPGATKKLLLPKEAEYETQGDNSGNGNGQVQEGMRNAMNQEMSVGVLGVTETTTSSDSSGYAQSQTHLKGETEVTNDDMGDEIADFNDPYFINILKSYGYPVSENGAFEHEAIPNINYLVQKSQVDVTIAKAFNLPLSKKYLVDTYSLVLGEGTDAVTLQQQPMNDPNNPDPSKPKDPSQQKRQKDSQPQNKVSTWWREFRNRLADFFAPAP